MMVTLGQQYNIGEKPTVILYTYINRHAGTQEKNKNKKTARTKQYIIKQQRQIQYNIEARTEDHDVDYLHNPESTARRYSPESRRRAVGDHTRR